MTTFSDIVEYIPDILRQEPYETASFFGEYVLMRSGELLQLNVKNIEDKTVSNYNRIITGLAELQHLNLCVKQVLRLL